MLLRQKQEQNLRIELTYINKLESKIVFKTPNLLNTLKSNLKSMIQKIKARGNELNIYYNKFSMFSYSKYSGKYYVQSDNARQFFCKDLRPIHMFYTYINKHSEAYISIKSGNHSVMNSENL